MAENQQCCGFNGKVLFVDLSYGKTSIEDCSPEFLREYLGGSLLGTYYVFKSTPPRIDPLSPENTLVFSPSVLTGAPISGASRFNVTAKSPLTGAIGDTFQRHSLEPFMFMLSLLNEESKRKPHL